MPLRLRASLDALIRHKLRAAYHVVAHFRVLSAAGTTVTGEGSAIHPGTGRKILLHSHRCATGPAARWQFQQSVVLLFVFERNTPEFLLIFQNLVDNIQQVGCGHHVYRGCSVKLALHQTLERA